MDDLCWAFDCKARPFLHCRAVDVLLVMLDWCLSRTPFCTNSCDLGGTYVKGHPGNGFIVGDVGLLDELQG